MNEKDFDIRIFNVMTDVKLALPFGEGIMAGFPSPVQDDVTGMIDLNSELIVHPASTFYGRISGNSMRDAGIEDGDIIIIDKSLELRDGDIAVCCVDGEFTVKYVRIGKNKVFLVPANTDYPIIEVTSDNDFIIWGIVTYTIKNNRKHRF